jgi:hypothetical protein
VQLTSTYDNDMPTMFLYNSDNQLVGQCGGDSSCVSTLLASPYGGAGISLESLTFVSNSDDIAYILAAGQEGSSGFDSVSVNMVAVPEPGPLVLLAAGLGAMLLARRRNRAACLISVTPHF